MAGSRTLTAEEAEDVVDQRIEEFGLGALPEVTVQALPQGRWRVAWTDRAGRSQTTVTQAMTMTQWQRWLEEYVGPVSPEQLVSSEG